MRLNVTVAVAAVGAGELAVDVDGDTCFTCTGAGIVAWKNAGDGGGDDEGFRLSEKSDRNTDGLILRGETGEFAIEGIDQEAAEACGRDSEDLAPSHSACISLGKLFLQETSAGRVRNRL